MQHLSNIHTKSYKASKNVPLVSDRYDVSMLHGSDTGPSSVALRRRDTVWSIFRNKSALTRISEEICGMHLKEKPQDSNSF